MNKALLMRPIRRDGSLWDGAVVRKYLIVDRYKGVDHLVGGVWAKTADEALKLWRWQQQGKADI